MDGFTGGGEALALTKLLQYISSIKADCMARQQANDAQLSTMVAEQDRELEEETVAEKNAGEFADEIGDGLILRVKVMRCMLIKKSSLEKLLMCKKSIMMFSMIDAKRPVKELRTQW
ncbi:hypothetical protein Bca52824_053948 [Brassica carinata]|uniref:Uncharacterized protein n=1 Tax=Brassica carinata TaxID=52824 RepID=A0A8X7R4X0_BRACI|nr:hypothetical protein Bca52824_053948 [Brassica carinata]